MADLYPWQHKLLTKMTQFKGRGVVQITGRNMGKSTMTAQAIKRLMDDLNNRPVEDLILSEGKVYGARYYCIQPIGGNWLEMETWALDTYGDPGDHMWGEKEVPSPAQRWYMNNRKFWFRHEKDRDWFILKWRS